MKLNTYLHFSGRCEEAFKFYERCLGGKIVAMFPHEGSPMAGQVPADWQKKIMHARLVSGDAVLMGSDNPPGCFEKPAGFSVSINVEDPADAERLFKSLSENGNVQMPLAETFWALRFGMFVDQFGIPWMINCEKAM